ncbi:MAG: hypothetical protein LR015_09010 [Verrucomicrobia bacterium]|nr:hypothetical protein [Verrucomicrobiota bacterium]
MLLLSFLIRYTRNIAAMSAVMTGLMVITYYLQRQVELAWLWGAVWAGCLVWLLLAGVIIKKAMLDLAMELAWVLYPVSAVTSVVLGFFLSTTVEADLQRHGIEGVQHYTILVAGITIALFLLVRCSDIKFLPSMSEIRRD